MVEKVKRLDFESIRILCSNDVQEIREKYEKLVNLIAEYGGRVHGSQHNSTSGNEHYDPFETIAVYFKIPKDALDQFNSELNA